MKKVYFVSVVSFLSQIVFAQDVIVKRDGSSIISKVLEVNTDDVKYKKFSNLNGPTYTIKKSDLLSINYENGEKDTFSDVDNVNTSSSSGQSPRMINKPADKRNTELIQLYNRHHSPTGELDKKNSVAKYYLLILGVKSSSIMSNEDIEMKIVKDYIVSRNDHTKKSVYYINLTNKTNRTLYIDKGNCFKLYNNGGFYCYYDNTEQITVNMGGGSGASLGLGSVAGALGIGGTIGQLADGVKVGGGSSHSVSKSYSQQRVIAIPPHGNRNLSEYKSVQTKKGNLFSDAEYTSIDKAESFNFSEYDIDLHEWHIKDFKLERGLVKRGEVLTYNENESPWKREFVITYSTDEYFRTYSSIKSELYLHEIMGCGFYEYNNNEKQSLYIEGLNQFSIVGTYWTDK